MCCACSTYDTLKYAPWLCTTDKKTRHMLAATAIFSLVPIERLADMCVAAEAKTLAEWRKTNAKTAAQYARDGWLVAAALGYLDEAGDVNLTSSEHDEHAARLSEALDGQSFILTAAHKAEHYEDLDLEAFDREELQAWYEELNGEATPGIGAHVLDAIRALREALSKTDAAKVVVVTIT